MTRIYNFAAGPSAMPLSVLEQAAAEMTDWHGLGLSILEMSHRSKDFIGIYRETVSLLRELYGIPDEYEVMFLQGGGHLEFAMVPMNFSVGGCGNYAVNGVWSKKAFKEAQKIGEAAEAACVDLRAPRQDEIKLTENASYLYYCSNETVNGIRYWYTPELSVPLIADMSSDFLSQPVDVRKFGLIFAGAQKNFGPAGLTVVIARRDLLGRADPSTPTMLDYETYAKSESMYNTPPTFAIYIANLVARWLLDQGGVKEMQRRSVIKSQILYDLIDQSEGFYYNNVEKISRSRMNVVFNLKDESLNDEFVRQAYEKRLANIKGHRILGGMRASLYNAVSIEAVEVLADYMKKFAEAHS